LEKLYENWNQWVKEKSPSNPEVPSKESLDNWRKWNLAKDSSAENWIPNEQTILMSYPRTKERQTKKEDSFSSGEADNNGDWTKYGYGGDWSKYTDWTKYTGGEADNNGDWSKYIDANRMAGESPNAKRGGGADWASFVPGGSGGHESKEHRFTLISEPKENEKRDDFDWRAYIPKEADENIPSQKQIEEWNAKNKQRREEKEKEIQQLKDKEEQQHEKDKQKKTDDPAKDSTNAPNPNKPVNGTIWRGSKENNKKSPTPKPPTTHQLPQHTEDQTSNFADVHLSTSSGWSTFMIIVIMLTCLGGLVMGSYVFKRIKKRNCDYEEVGELDSDRLLFI